MKKALKIVLGIVLSFVGVIVVICGVGFLILTISTKNSMKELDAIPTANVEEVPDGTYEGSAESGPVAVIVNVTVKDHKIENIELIKHQCGQGKPAEAIIDVMMNDNTTKVDAVSGATVSSKAIMAAVNNALNSAKTQQ